MGEPPQSELDTGQSPGFHKGFSLADDGSFAALRDLHDSRLPRVELDLLPFHAPRCPVGLRHGRIGHKHRFLHLRVTPRVRAHREKWPVRADVQEGDNRGNEL